MLEPRLKFTFLLVLPFIFCVVGQNSSSNYTTDAVVSSSSEVVINPTVSTTNTPLNNSCEAFSTCEECLGHKDASCYFCKDSSRCFSYTLRDLIPTDKCSVKDVYYYSCKVSFLVIASLSGVAIGLFLIGLIICCCCCCKRRGIKFSKEDLKWARQREERKAKAEEKKKERAERTLEIRRKYGLFKDDAPYQRFDT